MPIYRICRLKRHFLSPAVQQMKNYPKVVLVFLGNSGRSRPRLRIPNIVSDTVNLNQTTFGAKDADLYRDLFKRKV